MTLPPRPTYSCLGKEAFPEKRHADAAASRVATRARGAVCAYRCTFCHAWHVGSGSPQGQAQLHLQARSTMRAKIGVVLSRIRIGQPHRLPKLPRLLKVMPLPAHARAPAP